MKTKIIFIFMIFFSVVSCRNKMNVSGQVTPDCNSETITALPGKIAIEPYNSEINKCEIHYQGKLSKFSLFCESERAQGGIIWINKRDLFLASEAIFRCKNEKCILKTRVKNNLVLIDTSGKFVDMVYESKEHEGLSLYYPSPNDSLLLFFTHIDKQLSDPRADLIDELTCKATLNIMDFRTKKIIKKVENFATFLQMDIKESPWSADESQFVYGINNERKVNVEGQKAYDTSAVRNGLYIYDLKTGQSFLISKTGKRPTWSPGGANIAYVKDKDKLWLYDPINKKESLLFTSYINYYHWTPDGKYVYVKGKGTHHLIRISDKKVFKLEKGIGNFANITWKNDI